MSGVNVGFAQQSFNHRFAMGVSAWFSNVHELENGYVLSGHVADTLNGVLFFQTATLQLNLDGDTSQVKLFGELSRPYFATRDSDTEILGLYTQVGYTDRDIGPVSTFLWYDAQGDTLLSSEQLSPFFLEHGIEYSLMRPVYAFMAADSSLYTINSVRSPQFRGDGLLRKLSPQGEALWDYLLQSDADFDLSFAGCDLIDSIVVSWTQGYENSWFYNNGFFNKTYFHFLSPEGNLLEVWDLEALWGLHISQIYHSLRSGDNLVFVGRSAPSENWQSEAFIGKCNLDGNLIWYKRQGRPTQYHAPRWFGNVVQTRDSNFVAGGNYVNYTTYEPFPGADGLTTEIIWLSKFDQDTGDSLWTRYLWYVDDPDAYHNMFSMRATKDGGVIICGEARYYDPADSLFTQPGQQAWVVKLDECGCLVPGCDPDCVYTPEPEAPVTPFSELPFIIGPNPASQYLNIYLFDSGSPNTEFLLFDLNGRLIRSFKAPQMNTTYILGLEAISSGIYILQGRAEHEVIGEMKVVVE